MKSFSFPSQHASSDESAVLALYQQVIEGWNLRDAEFMTATFALDGEIIGFDGTQIVGKSEIASHLQEIFAHHLTPPYYTKVRSVRMLGPDFGLLRAVAGMIPSGQTELKPELHTHQTLVATKKGETWQVTLFQNTPAQYHGRPELVEQLTQELKEALN
ncbi:SgcJ/EcaC family oxidoreductase [Brevibacillus sp. NRS-1366]|uniref:SgcJ/EcaC family oxidoreductase n=1 Tax=Brevibacillus sp. NRS-1366 TaxID=3233899 RepID=UPI003D251E83